MAPQTVLDIQGISLGYGPNIVVKSVSLTIRSGQTIALIGANGAGKTTLLRGVSGLIPARTGSIHFAGRAITGQPAYRIARAGLVHVPEGRQIFAGLTITENLRMGGNQVTDRVELQQRFDAVFTRFPILAQRRHQNAGLLSGGEQQMLALGRALMAGPRLLILDEPSMGLAPLFVDAIFEIIADLKREGRTILLVEQNARAALAIADYAYVLETGTITLQGRADRLANDPAIISAYLGGP